MSLFIAIYDRRPIQEIRAILEKEKAGEIPKSDYNALLKSTLFSIYNFDKKDRKQDAEAISHLLEIAQLLVDYGALVNQKLNAPGEKSEYNPYLLQFYVALGSSAFAVVEFLLKNKADPRLRVDQEPLLRACIKHDAFDKELAEILIKYGCDVNESGGHNATPVIKAIHLGNNAALEFLCQHKADPNLPSKLEVYPLQEAINYKNHEVIFILLKHGANPFILNMDWLDSLLAQKEGKAAFEFILKTINEKLKVKGAIDNLSLSDIQNIPFNYLNLDSVTLKSIQDRLLAIVKESALPIELRDKLISVLQDSKLQSPLKKLSKLNIIAECCQMLLKPETLDQGETNLCGPASVLSALLNTSPIQLMDFCCKLLFQGKTTQPLACDLSKHSRNQAYSVFGILLTEMRRASNITGYSPQSFREGFQGLTHPKLIGNWLQAFGYSAFQDHTFILNRKGTALSKPLQFALDLAFFGFHQKNRPSVSISPSLSWLSEQFRLGNEIILLLSAQFIDKIEEAAIINYPDRVVSHPHVNSCCGIPIDHYVYLKGMKLSEDGKLQMQFWTWGKQREVSLSLEEFQIIYRGAIVAQKPSAAPKLGMLKAFEDHKLAGSKFGEVITAPSFIPIVQPKDKTI